MEFRNPNELKEEIVDMQDASETQTEFSFEPLEEVKKTFTGRFIKKKDLLGKTYSMKIMSVFQGQFNQKQLQGVNTATGQVETLPLSNELLNSLIDKLGGKTLSWKDHILTVIGKEWQGLIDNQMVKGVKLELLSIS